jgi:peptidoglycan/LPS O-acetylase OafA/YrhL
MTCASLRCGVAEQREYLADERRWHGVPVRMTQLDGLRAVAIALVLVTHYAPRLGLPLDGGTGVRLFFVLSGFLITRNLLTTRRRQDATFLAKLGDFYTRRAFRIMPAYYVALGVGVLVAGIGAAEGLGWHLLFATNLQIAWRGHWVGPFSPFWTLAVEQQFYLVWPFLVLTLPTRLMVRAMIVLVAYAWIYRIASLMADAGPLTLVVLPFNALDALALGGLLAVFGADRSAVLASRGWTILACLGITLVILLRLHIVTLPSNSGWVIADGVETAVLTLLVARATGGLSGVVGVVLESPAIRLLGVVSYGVYLNHMFLLSGAKQIGLHDLPWPLGFALFAGASILLGGLSWRFIERPAIAALPIAGKSRVTAPPSEGVRTPIA